MHNALNRCLVLSPSRGLYSFRAQDKAGRFSPVDPGISRGVADLNLREGTHARSKYHTQLAKLSFDEKKKTFLSDLTAEECFSFFIRRPIPYHFNTVISTLIYSTILFY